MIFEKRPTQVPMITVNQSSRCQALILSPLRLMRVIAERKRLYRKKDQKFIFGNEMDERKSCRIGEGGFGSVFRYVYNNRDVAIKQLHRSRHSPTSDFHSFCSELNAFRLPPSPYVVQTIAFTSSKSCMQVITEFIEGKNLQQLINDETWQVDIHQRLQLALQIISGLVHCHSHLLLHLDVKPANIFVDATCKKCKLSDFGCSRTAVSTETDILHAEITRSSCFGTVAYKAPELLKGLDATDRADIYSFSLVLWELLARKAAFDRVHPHVLIYGIVARRIRPKIDELNFLKEKKNEELVTLLQNGWSEKLTKRPRAVSVQQIIKMIVSSKTIFSETTGS
ncbi:unnamed protein product [Thelazia callipaeda]|uniref:non-specific serine/threonine protein kinase n=1 Tax=Thelazia callipaeda TaxID=103827 RepID=A0A0N5DCA1_THECL|nr:unnamed protein product [Thelazia callipaeda]